MSFQLGSKVLSSMASLPTSWNYSLSLVSVNARRCRWLASLPDHHFSMLPTMRLAYVLWWQRLAYGL